MIFAFLIIISIIILIIYIDHRNKEYENFVKVNSKQLKNIRALNNEYNFYDQNVKQLVNEYDNNAFYENIFPKDYLIYELANDSSSIEKDIKNIRKNKEKYDEYLDRLSKIDHHIEYDNYYKFKINKIIEVENRLKEGLIKHPTIDYKLFVKLIHKDMNENQIERKYSEFDDKDIKELLKRINNKRGFYYLDNDIWESIAMVERGKVTNKIRFSIFKRDNYTCQMCHKKFNSNGLEIDHIYPISKGGKSNYNNLQTLCVACNKKKGNKIIYGD